MSLVNRPFVSAGDTSNVRCVLCNESISVDAEITTSEKTTLDKHCKEWATVDARVCEDAPYVEFRNASKRLDLIAQRPSASKFTVHKTCGENIRKRLMRKQQQARNLPPLPPPIIEGDQAETVEDGLLSPSRIRRQSHDRCRQKICFVCEERGDETLPYNNGGVGRCKYRRN